MDIQATNFGQTINACCRSMQLFGRTQYIVVLLSILSTCAYGLSVDFSRLRQLRRPFVLDKRGGNTCTGNPCPAWQPFLCQSSSVCIALESVCDGHPDCPDHYDEDEELCNARKRPSVEMIYKVLNRNRKWALQKLFSGADLELVSHAFAVGKTIDDIAMMIGVTPDAEENLVDAFYAALENDQRALLKMGMPKGEWYDLRSLFSKLVEGGLEV